MGRNKANAFQYTAFAIKMLEKLINPKFKIEGLDNIPQKPVLFVANHFTRFETTIIPYLIYKHTNRQVRSLADASLFRGGMGDFLTKVGTLSTKDPNRNKTILADLISGRYDWMIYPEGSMIKSKEINAKDGFTTNTPYGISRTKTGATVLALQSELYRQELVEAYKDKKTDILQHYQDEYGLEYSERLQEIGTHIVPINITYYPIRPGENIIQQVAKRFLKTLPKVVSEELEIEGNLILSANINISFGKAIKIADYSKTSRLLINQIPLVNSETKHNLVIQYLKYRLTSEFMSDIYFDTKINLDHIFAAIIFEWESDEIEIEHLKNIIYNTAIDIKKLHKYRLSYSILEENLFKIFSDEPHEEFDGVVKLAFYLDIIKESHDGKSFIINKDKISQEQSFHDIRKTNTLKVIFNEFSLLESAKIALKRSLKMDIDDLREEVFEKILGQDIENFKEDYKKYYNAGLSKQEEVGTPFFLEGEDENAQIGIVMCHGYQSAPQEVRSMANHFNKLGFSIYAPRLKGHGTAPRNMKEISHDDWYDSFQRGYCALSRKCSKIIFIGFSTGGLLSLLSCSKKATNKVFAVVTVNPALKLQDIRARLIVPGLTIWNEMLSKFKISKGTLEYVENNSENPSVNYSKNYLLGVNELGKLMDKCWHNLGRVKNPALMIYSKNDPVVKASSSKIINSEIKSKIKELVEIDANRHIIIIGENSDKVFKAIENFIFELLNEKND